MILSYHIVTILLKHCLDKLLICAYLLTQQDVGYMCYTCVLTIVSHPFSGKLSDPPSLRRYFLSAWTPGKSSRKRWSGHKNVKWNKIQLSAVKWILLCHLTPIYPVVVVAYFQWKQILNKRNAKHSANHHRTELQSALQVLAPIHIISYPTPFINCVILSKLGRVPPSTFGHFL